MAQKPKLKLQAGFQHILIPVGIFIVLFGVMGMYFLLRSHAAPLATNQPKPGWIINDHAVTLLQSAGASTTLTDVAFNKSNGYVTSSGAAPSIGTATATYQSYQNIQKAFANDSLPGKFKAVLYDNEDWSLTPKVEQQNPAHYDQLAAALVHKHGLTFIATPATDIVKSTGQLVSGSIYATYLQRNIAADAARYADVYDIQAQGTETNLTNFTHFVTTAAGQARKANPKVTVFVGLSTNPSGRSVTNAQLYAAYSAVRPQVNGYWLNIPGQSINCSNCGTPQPKAALYLLQQLYGKH